MKTFLEYLKDQGVNKLFAVEIRVYGIGGGVEGWHKFTEYYIDAATKDLAGKIEGAEYLESIINIEDLEKRQHLIRAYDIKSNPLSTDKYLKASGYKSESLNWGIANIKYLEIEG